MILDVIPAAMFEFIVDGTLIIEDTQNFIIVANIINVRTGTIIAGNVTTPFTHLLIFVL
jgi:uncharacterized protein (DUF1015 family)